MKRVKDQSFNLWQLEKLSATLCGKFVPFVQLKKKVKYTHCGVVLLVNSQDTFSVILPQLLKQ